MAIGRGPGGGPKRRVRTRLNRVGSTGSTLYMVSLNRSTKPLPYNWRELLTSQVIGLCRQPAKRFFGRGAAPFPSPIADFPAQSTPSGMFFTLDSFWHDRQRRALDVGLMLSDVHTWPYRFKTSATTHAGNIYVNTGLQANDDQPHAAALGITHQLVLANYASVPGLEPSHLRTYVAGRGKGKYLGAHTICGHDCSCRQHLLANWSVGWMMHY